MDDENNPPRKSIPTPPWGWLRSAMLADQEAARSLARQEMKRLSWEEICQRPECAGRWVALHRCVYDEATGKATEGDLVDIDDDLAALCERVKDSEWKNCAILRAQGLSS